MGNEKFAKSREDSEVREFPSHHCQPGFLLNPGIICRLICYGFLSLLC